MTINSSNFSVNGVDIRFTPFSYPNVSSIKTTVFAGGVLPDPGYMSINSYTYPGNNQFFGYANSAHRTSRGIWQWGVTNVTIQTNTFASIEAAMESFDAKYNVTGCNFDNLTWGIRIFNTSGTLNNGHVISANIFNHIKQNNSNQGGYMIQIEGGKYDKIINGNKFRDAIQGLQSDNYIGIFLNNTSNFDITDNDFNRLPMGIQCYNSADGGGFVRAKTRISTAGGGTGNHFVRCAYNVKTFQNNSALQIKCNTSPNPVPADYGSGTNWLNFAGYNIMADQGQYSATNSRKPAGNAFPQITPARNHITNDAYIILFGMWGIPIQVPLGYNYYAHSNPPERIPTTVGGIDLDNTSAVYVDGVSCAPCQTYPPCKEFLVQQNNQMISQLQQEYLSVLTNVDKGQTTQLLSALSNNMAEGNLKNLLLNKSPLSDTVLLSVINKGNPLSPGTFKNIIIPNSPVSNRVRYDLNTKLPSLPPGISKQIKEAQATTANRTITAISREIEQLTTERQLALNEVVDEKTSEDSLDAALLILAQETTVNAKQTLIATYLADSNLQQAYSEWNNFVPVNSAEAEWKEVIEIMLSIADSGNSVFEIDSAQEALIRQLAYASDNQLANINAQAMLRLLYGEEFYPPAQPSAKMANATNPQQSPDFAPAERYPNTENIFWQLFPNPADNHIELQYRIGSEQKGKVEICTALGTKIKDNVLLPEGNKLTISTGNFESGVYFFKFIINGELIETKKIIILKK